MALQRVLQGHFGENTEGGIDFMRLSLSSKSVLLFATSVVFFANQQVQSHSNLCA